MLRLRTVMAVQPNVETNPRRRGPRRKLNEAQERALVDVYSSGGVPVSQIAAAFRVSVRTVYATLTRVRGGQ